MFNFLARKKLNNISTKKPTQDKIAIMSSNYSFIDSGIIKVYGDCYVDNIPELIEEISSPEALEYVHTVEVCMDTLSRRGKKK